MEELLSMYLNRIMQTATIKSGISDIPNCTAYAAECYLDSYTIIDKLADLLEMNSKFDYVLINNDEKIKTFSNNDPDIFKLLTGNHLLIDGTIYRPNCNINDGDTSYKQKYIDYYGKSYESNIY